MSITREQLLDLANYLDGEVYEDYSGRAMYGATCPGITADVTDVKVGFAIATLLGEVGDLAEIMADCTRTDNMGRSTIFYWPDIELVD